MPAIAGGAEANWAHQTIWTGDNLDIMRGMNSESVDLIYLDPPFNSNQNYAAPIGSEAAGAAFKDTWTLDDVDLAWHGEIAEQHPALYTIIAAAREAHSAGMMSYLIMMAVRLLEMRRLLKPTGSIYLHCDDTAVHYLKMVMDAVFPSAEFDFRAHIIWKRQSSKNDSSTWGRVADHILQYGAPITNPDDIAVPLDSDYVERYYRLEDERGRYQSADLTGPGTTSGESGQPWKGFDPTDSGRCWSVPRVGSRGKYARWIADNVIPGYDELESIHERLNALDDADMVYWSSKGTPRLKRYLTDSKQVPGVIWSDISIATKSERTKYPTQKPLSLLKRIIQASSNEGDMILDPFCGCATACVAAQKLGRQWVGIDISPKAAELVNHRLQTEIGLEWNRLGVHRTDVPQRSDLGELPHYKTHKHTLFGRQEGRCNGCRTVFPFQNFTIDHIVPQVKGGSDHIDNLQLLCNHCNSVKGTGTQEELLAKLRTSGIIGE